MHCSLPRQLSTILIIFAQTNLFQQQFGACSHFYAGHKIFIRGVHIMYKLLTTFSKQLQIYHFKKLKNLGAKSDRIKQMLTLKDMAKMR